MVFDELLKGIRSDTFVFSFLAILCIILPGVATIYIFEPALFSSIDWIKLILLSSAITLPFIFLNTIFASDAIAPEEEDGLFKALTLGAIMTNLVFFAAICTAYVLLVAISGSPKEWFEWLYFRLDYFGVRLHVFTLVISFILLEPCILVMMKKDAVERFIERVVATIAAKLKPKHSEAPESVAK